MKKFLLCSNIGKGKTILNSFDSALLSSGVANYNLVNVSSILPPHAQQADKVDLPEGSILFTAYATKYTIDKDVMISAAIAVGIPQNPNDIGVIMEFSSNICANEAKKRVSEMVVEAMNNRGIEIKEILCKSAEAIGNGHEYVSVFAGLAMW